MLPQFLNIKKNYVLIRFCKDNDVGYLIEKNLNVIRNRIEIKHKLDQPNIKGKEDIELKFENK